MKDRLLAGSSLIALVLVTCFLEARLQPVLPTLVLVVALAGFGTYEFVRMLTRRGLRVLSPLLVVITALHLLAVSARALEGVFEFPLRASFAWMSFEGLTVALLLLSLGHAILRGDVREGVERAMWTLFTFVLVAGGMGTLVALRGIDPRIEGLELLVFFVAIAKSGDICGYFVGRAIGRHRAIPKISPGKTWEGFIASFAGALLVAGLLEGAFGFFPGERSLPLVLGAGACINVAAQFGDLAMSLVKRRLDLKDTGATLPGIGGVLDLVDSFLFAGPVFVLYLRLLGAGG